MEFRYLTQPNKGEFFKGSLSKRLQDFKTFSKMYGKPMRSPCGPYTFRRDSDAKELSFYLESDFMPVLRWKWCDDVARSIRHTGWFIDDYQDEKIRGLIMALPHGRGFLAGWSMGEGMISVIETHIYDDEIGAALAADSTAEYVAEQEREYREEQEAEDEGEQETEE